MEQDGTDKLLFGGGVGDWWGSRLEGTAEAEQQLLALELELVGASGAEEAGISGGERGRGGRRVGEIVKGSVGVGVGVSIAEAEALEVAAQSVG